MDSRWRKAALVSQSLLLIYFEICTWIPLGAWNGQWAYPEEQSFSTSIGPLAIGLGTAVLIVATALRIRWLMWIGIIGHSTWFIAQATSIWPPYFVGASPQYAAMYSRVWGRTTKILPSWGDHLAPDAMHVFIQVLLLALLVATIAVLRTDKGTKSDG
ncbi:MAG: hypothetical protein ACM3JB_24140 [Acidobacteriaceae bacterium]